MRTAIVVSLLLLVSLPLAAQAPGANELEQARQMYEQARQAGADALATSLYDDAASRIRFAQDNWLAKDARLHEQSRMRAREATFEAGAALSKARWLSTNAAIRTLQTDIRGFGGTSDLALAEEVPAVDYHRGTATRGRIAAAQAALDQARQAGAMSQSSGELETAQQYIESARKVSRNGAVDNDIADHLAFTSEMMSRRAYYDARFRGASNMLPDVRLQRTRLAQAASERAAALEREQREASERATLELQQRLAAEQQNRAAQAAELDRLRAQIDEGRRARLARIEADRQARVAAEQKLADLDRVYITAILTASPADVDAVRRQIEDQQLALRAIRAREDYTRAQMDAEITRSRTDLQSANTAGSLTAEVLSQRQADLLARQAEYESMRRELEADAAQRAAIDQQEAAAIADAQRRRQDQEAAAAELRRQTEAAQRQAQEAEAAAQAAQQQAQEAQQQAQTAQQQAQSAQQEAESAKQQQAEARQQAEAARHEQAEALRQAEAARQQTAEASQQAAVAQSELEKTKRELAESTAEAHRLRLQQSLAQFAATHNDPARGIIVTLPSIMFDTGKATLKAGAKKVLKNIAGQLKGESTLVVTVEGHTDNVGPAAKNLKLSEQRAHAVREYLVTTGIAPDHLTSVGRGEADPVASNKTANGRQQNRRVELIIAQ
jgi:outer membrane protein OmpA-like peptidoglycan-associated protein